MADEPQYTRIYVMPGVVATNEPGEIVKAREERQREAGRNRPGSIYYASAPPDEDDYWCWCHMCRCWHPHDPCF